MSLSERPTVEVIYQTLLTLYPMLSQIDTYQGVTVYDWTVTIEKGVPTARNGSVTLMRGSNGIWHD